MISATIIENAENASPKEIVVADTTKTCESLKSDASPKLLSHYKERKWQRMRRLLMTFRPATSKLNALANQQLLGMIRTQRKRQAEINEFAYSETIQRLISSLLYEILTLGPSELQNKNPTFSQLTKMCLKPEFVADPLHRKETWKFIEDNIDILLENALQKIEDDDDDDDNDENRFPPNNGSHELGVNDVHVNGYLRYHSLKLSLNVYESCLFKMRQIQEMIQERDRQHIIAIETEREICADMFTNFKLNGSFENVGVVVNRVPPNLDEESVTECGICTKTYNGKLLAVILRCCSYKQSMCCECLLKTAFSRSNMGQNSFFKCVFCNGEHNLYDHLDVHLQQQQAPVQPIVAEQSIRFAPCIGDSVKQNKRKRGELHERTNLAPPSPPRIKRRRGKKENK